MIKLYNINKTYNKDKNNECIALKDINLEFDGSGLTIIVGSSGCGKSTLLNIISGLDYPTSGSIDSSYGKNYTSFVYQDSQFINDYSVFDNLKMVQNDDEQIIKYLKYFNLEEFKSHKTNELSGGQKQRIAIIRALLLDKPIMLCDEPTGNLDSKNALEVAKLLKDVSKDKTIIVVTHDESLFKSYANRIIKISDGVVVDDYIINSNKPIDNNIQTNSLNPHFKDYFKYALKNIKRTRLRYILSLISLTISLTIILLSLNVFLINKEKARYKVYNDNSLEYLDIYGKDNEDNIRGTTIYEYDELSRINTSTIRCCDDNLLEFHLNNCNIYFDTITKYNVIYGKDMINDTEMIISDIIAKEYIARENLTIEIKDLIGYKINEISIAGIYESPYINDVLGSYRYKKLARSIFMSYKAYKQLYKNNEIRVEVLCGGTISFSLTKDETLSNNNVIVSKGLNKWINPENLESFTLKCFNEKYYQKGIGDNYITYETLYDNVSITIASVLDYSGDFMYCSEELYDYFFDLYLLHNTYFGITYKEYDTSLIRKIDTNNYQFDTDYEPGYYNAYDFNLRAGYIEIAFGALLIIITITLIFNYVIANYTKNKKEVGLLCSLWIPKNKIKNYFILDVLLLMIVSLIMSIILSLCGLHFQNYILVKTDLTYINYLYYQFIPILIGIALLIITFFLTLLFVDRKIKKSTIIDLIYDRN